MAKSFDLSDSMKAAAQVPATAKKFSTSERENMIRINLRCSQQLRDNIEEAARVRDMSFSEYIRATMREAVARDLGL